jgi:hypothetical protein
MLETGASTGVTEDQNIHTIVRLEADEQMMLMAVG